MALVASQLGDRFAHPLAVSNVAKATNPAATPVPAVAYLFKYTLTAPTAASTTKYLSTGVAGPNATTKTVLVSAFDGTYSTGIPDFPRNAVVTVTHATAVVANSGTITGTDRYGKALTEAWSVTAATTSKTFTGKKSFATITQITITAATDASANTVKLGTGAVFGLPYTCPNVNIIGEMTDAAIGTAGTIVAASSASTADPRGTYAPNAAPDASKTYVLYFICDDPTTSTTV
ncbi:hypothetical protein UFOVP1537_53 [uncultured Caudovirales phage]|uniref:Uncharacterized protein n=2 Tax=root TaxID=1 RepID=A0A6J5PQ47_9CAUD|nr:hypothetical protein UFOVP825_18 [uncultured Caudovirales phage]CAB4171355.1 hypothetical protein UFOVP915_53 [uncultured Caudovirales phage]CAB4177200.1 hypothetical protein UFOVP1000_17 [uncultured Caudovirales phage]CAB4183248.1 hypothetical protein UFOVP1092_45 [uncultured Caudovirales phage]CAB4187708.1 hypothetical protein UFOVP1152_49 [uncultured Caudovirales phage]